jgi:DNA-binding transcriptional regulator YhcF (GntR family)
MPDRLAQKIGKLIDQGLLKHGDRLPSIRAGAIEYGVAKNTLVEAYERLVALGYIRAQQGSGFFVSKVSPKSEDGRSPHIAQAVDMILLLRSSWSSSMLCVWATDDRRRNGWKDLNSVGTCGRSS